MKIIKRRKALTLTEAMLALVILGIAAAGVIIPFSSGAAIQADGYNRTLAANLAIDLMERILKNPFEDVVDDFGEYTELQGQIEDDDDDGQVLSDPIYSNFSRSATCIYVYVSQQSGSLPPNYILATVTVYYKGNRMAQVERLIAK